MSAPATPPDSSSKPSVLKELGPAAVLGVLWAVMPAVLGIWLLASLGPVSDYLKSLGPSGWFLYILVFMLCAGFGFLPTYGQSLLGGWVFGFAVGFPGAMAGFLGGSVIGYAIAKRVSRERVRHVLDSNPKAHALHQTLVGHGPWRMFWIVTLIRLPPNSPFALTNLVLASSGVGFWPYLFGTALGLAPRTAIVSFAAALGSQRARDIQTFLREQPPWVTVLGVTITVLCLIVLIVIAERALKAVSSTKPAAAGATPPEQKNNAA
mgnify:CR=1 FL=1